VIKSVETVLDLRFEVRFGGLIGEDAIKEHGQWLPENTMEFCADVFQVGGVILNGAGDRLFYTRMRAIYGTPKKGTL
jgi:hypothetical protein